MNHIPLKQKLGLDVTHEFSLKPRPMGTRLPRVTTHLSFTIKIHNSLPRVCHGMLDWLWTHDGLWDSALCYDIPVASFPGSQYVYVGRAVFAYSMRSKTGGGTAWERGYGRRVTRAKWMAEDVCASFFWRYHWWVTVLFLCKYCFFIPRWALNLIRVCLYLLWALPWIM